MKKLRLVVELEYDNDLMHHDDEVARNWFMDAVLLHPAEHEGLHLHSDLIGDEVGSVKVLSVEDA
jgi:hypothetical protein